LIAFPAALRSRRRRIAAGAGAVVLSAYLLFRHYVVASSFESLPRPLFSQENGVGQNCNGSIAVDGDGDVWHESGCEGRSSGIHRQYRLLAAQRAQLRAALDRMRRLPDAPMPSGCNDGIIVGFYLNEASGTDRTWYTCQPAQGEDWPEPFASAQHAMFVEPTLADRLEFLHSLF
jgi:hypothetical protein